MTILTDYTFSAARVIDYVGAAHEVAGAGYYTGIALHRHFGDLSDDSEFSGDDVMDIMRNRATGRQGIDNIIKLGVGVTITDAAIEHLYDCSIIEDTGKIWDGIVCLSGTGTSFDVQLLQDGALIANDFWNSTPDGAANPGLNPDAAGGVSTRFLVQVATASADIDGRRLIGLTRVFGFTYTEFKINGTTRGNNSLPLTFRADLNNETAIGSMTSSPFSTVVFVTEGYAQIDVDNSGADENYSEEWDLGAASSPEAYERWKYETRHKPTVSTDTLHGLNGTLYRGITHDITVDNGAGTNWNAGGEELTWGSGATAGSGQLIAANNVSPASTTRLWIQLITGVVPTDGLVITGTTSTGNVQMNVTIAEEEISTPFCGQSTGSAVIGSHGLGVTALDLVVADKLFNLDDTGPLSPENNQDFDVNGGLTGDRLIVTNRGYLVPYDAENAGPFTVGELLTFDTLGSPYTAKLNELVDQGTTGYMWIGPTSNGLAPPDDDTIDGGTSSADAVVDETINPVINAPDLGQFSLNGALTGVTTAVVVNETIDADTPATGDLRIRLASGVYSERPYTSYAASTFTITSFDFTSDNAADGDNVHIGYIDKVVASDPESVTMPFSSPRTFFVRLRDGGGSPIKEVETSGVFGAGGGSAVISREADD